jgi:hypothetical protein
MEKAAAAVKKWDVKTWALVALGGVAVVASAAFVMQSKHAALGRQVHRNVLKFLQDHGSQVHSGVVSGGLVSTPMKTTTAVNSTVVSMLNGYADTLSNNPQGGAPAPGAQGGGAGEPVYTGRGGSQGPSIGGSGDGAGSALMPHTAGAPSPVPHASPRGSRASAGAAQSLTDLARNDDGGFLSPERGKQTDYNPAEFLPRGQKPSGNVDLFAGDGIPGSGSAPLGAAAAAYQ